MAQAEFRDVLSVVKDRLYTTITQYEKYPSFVDGCKSVSVDRKSPSRVRVTYHVNLMSQELHYVLDHQEDSESGRVEWSLVESNFFKKNTGKWELKTLSGGKTEVCYSLDVEFKIPVPGFILNKLVKGSLPSMVKSFEKQANGRG